MSWLQLDPPSIAARQRASGDARAPLSLAQSLFVGAVGFMLTSVGGFLPWAGFGHRLHPVVGEVGMYAACAMVFIALSGLFLHRLIIGPGAFARFYAAFAPAFALYALIWTVCWTQLRGDLGSLTGLLGGTAAMGILLALTFEALPQCLPIIAALFLCNAAGYYGGGWVEAQLVIHHRLAGMLLWGVCYGLGFGLGLGVAFYLCQSRARALLATPGQ